MAVGQSGAVLVWGDAVSYDKCDRIKRITIEIMPCGLYSIEAPSHRMIASELCREEALGCLASWIYGHRDDNRVPQFMESELMKAKNNRKWGRLTMRDRAVLIEFGEPFEQPQDEKHHDNA